MNATSSSLIRRGRPPAHRGSRACNPRSLNAWITSRTVSSSAATSRAIAGTGVPDADAMMIRARRTRTDPCLPRRTICCSRRPSSSDRRRARTGSAITTPLSPSRESQRVISSDGTKGSTPACRNPANVRGQRTSCSSQGEVHASAIYLLTLPDNPAPGTKLALELHDDAPADGFDRFTVPLGAPKEAQPTHATKGGSFLYQVTLEMETDDGKPPLFLGQALVATPHAPSNGYVQFWDLTN